MNSGPSLQTTKLQRSGFFAAVGQHFKNWAAEYTVIPITLAFVFGAAILQFALTGRRPQESVSWLGDYSSNAVKIAIAIAFVSACRQSFGTWYTREQLLEHPVVYVTQAVTSLALFFGILYALSH
jgi:hypothetical protein